MIWRTLGGYSGHDRSSPACETSRQRLISVKAEQLLELVRARKPVLANGLRDG
jgi:hypothetical protein